MTNKDEALIEQTFELLAEAVDDITPLVYEKFFAINPQALELFDTDSEMNRGHMLNEVFVCLMEQAAGKTYLDDVFKGHVTDHVGYGVKDLSMYTDFLTALRETIAELLGKNWPGQAKEAFERQCDLMNERFLEAEKFLVDQGLMKNIASLKIRNFGEK